MAVSPSDSLQTSRTSDHVQRLTAKKSGAAPAKGRNAVPRAESGQEELKIIQLLQYKQAGMAACFIQARTNLGT